MPESDFLTSNTDSDFLIFWSIFRCYACFGFTLCGVMEHQIAARVRRSALGEKDVRVLGDHAGFYESSRAVTQVDGLPRASSLCHKN